MGSCICYSQSSHSFTSSVKWLRSSTQSVKRLPEERKNRMLYLPPFPEGRTGLIELSLTCCFRASDEPIIEILSFPNSCCSIRPCDVPRRRTYIVDSHIGLSHSQPLRAMILKFLAFHPAHENDRRFLLCSIVVALVSLSRPPVGSMRNRRGDITRLNLMYI